MINLLQKLKDFTEQKRKLEEKYLELFGERAILFVESKEKKLSPKLYNKFKRKFKVLENRKTKNVTYRSALFFLLKNEYLFTELELSKASGRDKRSIQHNIIVFDRDLEFNNNDSRNIKEIVKNFLLEYKEND